MLEQTVDRAREFDRKLYTTPIPPIIVKELKAYIKKICHPRIFRVINGKARIIKSLAKKRRKIEEAYKAYDASKKEFDLKMLNQLKEY